MRHKQGKMRKIPLTGKTQMTGDKRKVKFTPLSEFRALEPIELGGAGGFREPLTKTQQEGNQRVQDQVHRG